MSFVSIKIPALLLELDHVKMHEFQSPWNSGICAITFNNDVTIEIQDGEGKCLVYKNKSHSDYVDLSSTILAEVNLPLIDYGKLDVTSLMVPSNLATYALDEDEFINDMTGMSIYNFNQDKLTELLSEIKCYRIKNWICTDTEVGGYVLAWNDKFLGISWQQYRKGATDYWMVPVLRDSLKQALKNLVNLFDYSFDVDDNFLRIMNRRIHKDSE